MEERGEEDATQGDAHGGDKAIIGREEDVFCKKCIDGHQNQKPKATEGQCKPDPACGSVEIWNYFIRGDHAATKRIL